jgi:hypothetical protein
MHDLLFVSKEKLEPILQHAKPSMVMHDQNKNLWKLETQNLALIRDCQLPSITSAHNRVN